ncbi:MAG: hypothetical protein ACK5NG_10025 [Chthoniobacterales bacterium]
MQWIILFFCSLFIFVSPFRVLAEVPERKSPLGMWVWRADALKSEEQAKELIDFSRKHGIDTLLLQINFTEDDPPKLQYKEGLKRLLKLASEAGISVEALDGAPEMALAKERRENIKKLDAILDFQSGQPEGARFTAIHYDIEPYAMPQWKDTLSGRRVLVREMLETFAFFRYYLEANDSTGLLLKFDIPSWYGGNFSEIAIDFAGATKPLNEHVQDIADEVVIMSYRREPRGPNSVQDISREELDYAAKIGKKTSLALETIELKEDAHISFFGLPASQFRDAVHALYKDREGTPGFGGVYLHYYYHLKDYLADTEPLFPATK